MDSVRGVVVDFDSHKGYGTVRTDDGAELFFHCTSIDDGTRTIPVGTVVDVEVGPGLPGRWEAVVVRTAG